MIHNFGLIELLLSSLEWCPRGDEARLKREGIDLPKYLADLKVSMEKDGIKKPPVVEWHLHHTSSSSGKFQVLEGNHRCQIASQLGWKKIKCELRVIPYDNEWMVIGLKHLLQKEEV